jgi:FAD/FMN-containing dehydrogenase
MATTTSTPIQLWNNLHENGPWKTRLFHDTVLASKADLPVATNRYNDAAAEIQRLLRAALSSGEGFRAIGSRWSLSSIAHHHEQMQGNQMMNIKMAFDIHDLHANSVYKAENLFLLQCGNVVKEIHNFLNSCGKSLQTTGASNGQTIAGCISTGVHGSALDVGAVQDCVVGLNLIVGPEPADIVYLERASRPALSDAFAQKLKSRIIRDDELFNAALVSLGAFGFIHGVVIEAEDRFLLKRYVKRVNKTHALELATMLNFADSPFVTELMYKKPYQAGYPDPIPGIKTALYKDLIHLFIKIAEKWKNSIPKLISILKTSILPAVD